jgi:hypothetical protein
MPLLDYVKNSIMKSKKGVKRRLGINIHFSVSM